MEIKTTLNGTELVVACEGRLDTNTAPELEKVLNESMPQAESLVIDMTGLEYISSAGLRVLLSAHKNIGDMKVKGVNQAIMDIFEVTGFTDILNIER